MADTKQTAEGERIAEELQRTTTPDAGGAVAANEERDEDDLEVHFIPEERPSTH